MKIKYGKMNNILMPYQENGFNLRNHIVMAPMTRSRAFNNIPDQLMAEYYAQRAGAGLIITEGTAPVPAALGYPRIPGIFNTAQIEGWKTVTERVHRNGSRIFLQLMHTGRIGHIDNLPAGASLAGPSGIPAAGQIFTDTKGMQDHSTPEPLTREGIQSVIKGYVTAAQNAVAAGFDGIELHGANGYLPEQFLHPLINTRTDEYGGNIVNRARFILEVAAAIASAIGKDKAGVRLSPFSTLGDLPLYAEEAVHATYAYLAEEFNKIGIAYLHIGLNPAIPQKTLEAIRAAFTRTIILCNGFDATTAEAALQAGIADLIAFGRAFLANPDLVKRIEKNAGLNTPRMEKAFTPGAEGYTDYPFLS